MSKVDPVDSSDCWLWIGARNSRGVPVFTVKASPEKSYDYTPMAAHRLVYAANFGPIPEGCLLLRACANKKSCVNPAHLTVATPKQVGAKRRVENRKRGCIRGHKLTTKGSRQRCAVCQDLIVSARKQALKIVDGLLKSDGHSWHEFKDWSLKKKIVSVDIEAD